jgi:hypothetical protein
MFEPPALRYKPICVIYTRKKVLSDRVVTVDDLKPLLPFSYGNDFVSNVYLYYTCMILISRLIVKA